MCFLCKQNFVISRKKYIEISSIWMSIILESLVTGQLSTNTVIQSAINVVLYIKTYLLYESFIDHDALLYFQHNYNYSSSGWKNYTFTLEILIVDNKIDNYQFKQK